MKRLIAAFFPILCASPLPAQTVVLTPVKDTDVYSYTSAPTGSTYDLGVNNTPVTHAPGVHSQKSLIQFNLAGLSIPAAQIGTAKLRLYSLKPDSQEGGGFRPGNLVVYRQGSAWGTVTANYPNWNTIQPAGSPAASTYVSVVDQWIELDVTSLVKSWASGSLPNHGFVLQCQNEHVPLAQTTNLIFGSMELGALAAAGGLPDHLQPYPRLVITRAVVTPEPEPEPQPQPPPVLVISQGGAGVVIEWPVAGSTGWTLQTAESPAGTWTVLGGAVQQGGKWRIERPLNPSGRGFFRLRRP